LPTTPVISADSLVVANRLRPVLLQLARELRREVHPLGVTGGQVSLLVAIRRAPGIGVRDLAMREGVSPAAMSRHVSRLAAAGLVRRLEGSGGDRRRVGLELTDEAERAAAFKGLMDKYQHEGGYGAYLPEKLVRTGIIRIDIKEMIGKEGLGKEELRARALEALEKGFPLPIIL